MQRVEQQKKCRDLCLCLLEKEANGDGEDRKAASGIPRQWLEREREKVIEIMRLDFTFFAVYISTWGPLQKHLLRCLQPLCLLKSAIFSIYME